MGRTRQRRKTNVKADPAAWGDVILSRSDAPSSYHLSVVLDDASQGVSHVVRGMDLFHATSVHRLLQDLLALPVPEYHHHRLVLDDDGKKLSKASAAPVSAPYGRAAFHRQISAASSASNASLKLPLWIPALMMCRMRYFIRAALTSAPSMKMTPTI